ncbi:MAG TPA: hypothetical protein VFM16_06565 [Holophagaceae bacterium]|nr:hypothetical protein [Holophagaceae bacterium]
MLIFNFALYRQKQALVHQIAKLQGVYKDALPTLKHTIDHYPFPYRADMWLPKSYDPNLISPFRVYEFQLIRVQHDRMDRVADQIRADYQWNFIYDHSKVESFLEPFIVSTQSEEQIYSHMLDNYNDSYVTVRHLLPDMLIFTYQPDPGDFRKR